MNNQKFAQLMRIAFNKKIVTNSLEIAIIVGILLNIINQGGLIWTGKFAQLSYLKMGLTFLVPYGVATYSAIVTKIRD